MRRPPGLELTFDMTEEQVIQAVTDPGKLRDHMVQFANEAIERWVAEYFGFTGEDAPVKLTPWDRF